MTQEEREKLQDAFPNEYPSIGSRGMTLRDYFANSAMQGMITAKLNDPSFSLGVDNDNNKTIALVSYELADAMLKQREL